MANRLPFFSIVTPAYNSEDTIQETIDSVLAQTNSDFEYVIVNDGSNDLTGSIVDESAANNPCIKVIHQENAGSAGAINAGLAQAEGQFVCICSSDDLLLPNCLDSQMKAIRDNPGFHLLTSNGCHFHHDDGWERAMFRGAPWSMSHEIIFEDFLKVRFFGSGITFHREAAIAVGSYNSEVYAEDFDFYMRMFLAGERMWFNADFCVRQRVSDFQKSSNRLRIHESVMSVFEGALASESATLEMINTLTRSLIQYETDYAIEGQMIAQKEVLDDKLRKISNDTLRKTVKKMIFILTPLARPLRRLMAKMGNDEPD